jgi:hypothetical protein
MGRVLKHDVGKRVYRLRVSSVSGIYIWQVENETQFAHRRQGTA